MTTISKTQIGLLITAVVLFVLLFLAPKTHTGKLETKVDKKETMEVVSLETFITMATKSLKPEEKTTYDALVNTAKNSKVDTAFVPVVQFWDKQKRPDFAAYFVEQIAERSQTSLAYNKAGDRYYYSVRFTKDENEIPALYQSAMRCYQKAVDKDAKNVDAKIQLAACFVEEGKDPMKGIALLRDVEKTDSNNVKLQLTFAFFSVKSQQWDKAIKRFNKVLEIDPLYIEAYLHLADAYEQQSQTNKTIEMLQKYANLTEDAMAKQEVLKYIEQLKRK
ncbi:MAG: tetratricopeptide repeat protein [Bacteroidetes bacterium]|nr:tetratricopeptide repeat protein [Bacteroidota bacterium]